MAEAGVGAVLGAMFFSGLFIFFLFVIILGISILGMIFWIFMIIDAAKRKYKNENDKVLWILIVVLGGLIGAIVYYFVVKAKDEKPKQK